MVVLALGDVVGQPGCDHVRCMLPGLRKRYTADVVIANGENSAEGNGILPASARHLQDSGVDVITTGNHVLRRRQIYDFLDREDTTVLRPANYHPSAPGIGHCIYDAGRFQLCVINLQGVVYMQSLQNPFDCLEQLLQTVETPNIIVDFHAEATAEKLCLAHHFDGRVSAVVGTHTHVQTADARVMPSGTGYITDLGMCGGENSILGVRSKEAIYKMRTGLPVRFVSDPDDVHLSGMALWIDEQTGRCTEIEAFRMV